MKYHKMHFDLNAHFSFQIFKIVSMVDFIKHYNREMPNLVQMKYFSLGFDSVACCLDHLLYCTGYVWYDFRKK